MIRNFCKMCGARLGNSALPAAAGWSRRQGGIPP